MPPSDEQKPMRMRLKLQRDSFRRKLKVALMNLFNLSTFSFFLLVFFKHYYVK